MKHARTDYQRIQDPAHLIPENEPVFLLRAQDRTAHKVVRFWAWYNSLDHDSDKRAIQLANDHADLMEKWPVKKAADVP